MKLITLAQVVAGGITELDGKERRKARDLLMKLARERRLSPAERLQLRKLATKVGKGAARGARGKKRS